MLFLVQVVVLPTFGGALGYMEMLRERVRSAQTNHALVPGFPPSQKGSFMRDYPKKKQKKYTPGN